MNLPGKLSIPALLPALLLQPAVAAVFDFEDALSDLGHAGDPANYYQALGLTFNGSYTGVISGVSNGDPGNFNLEGTNGPASLAATSITTLGENIELNFSSQLGFLCFDLGAAWFSPAQTPTPLDIRIRSYLGITQQSDVTLTVEDMLKNGEGTWYQQSFSNIDRVHMESVAGNGTWAVDNIVTNEACPPAPDNNSIFIPIIDNNGSVIIINL